MIPLTWHSGKSKTIGTEKISVVARVWKGVRSGVDYKGAREDFYFSGKTNCSIFLLW